MGRHADEFLRLYRNGQIVGDGAIAAMAEQAIYADKAEREAQARHRSDRSARAVQAAQAATDDELYRLLFPTPEQAEARWAAAAADRERRSHRPLSDAEYDSIFGPES